jgi:DNA polymerase III subunit beta
MPRGPCARRSLLDEVDPMKVTVETKPLMNALAGATRIIERRASVPILSHVALEANGCLMLRATDLETAYETRIACQTHAAGVATVDARTLLAVLKRSQPSAPSERGAAQTVTLEASDPPKASEGADGASACADVRVAVNGTSARLVGLDPACFPTGAPRLRITLPAAMLAEMIDATVYAVSADEARYNLSGVAFERAGKEHVRMVATDGHRLALTERPLATERFAPFIIPRKLLAAVRTALGARPAGDVRIALRMPDMGAERSADGLAERPVVSFNVAGALYKGRTVEGEFPDYRGVIPKAPERRVALTVWRDALRLAIGAVMPFSNARYRGVRLAFASGRLTVSASDPERGEASESIAANGYVRDSEMAAGFNAGYLLGAIATLGDEILFRLADAESPCVLTTAGATDSPQAVVMPLRL